MSNPIPTPTLSQDQTLFQSILNLINNNNPNLNDTSSAQFISNINVTPILPTTPASSNSNNSSNTNYIIKIVFITIILLILLSIIYLITMESTDKYKYADNEFNL